MAHLQKNPRKYVIRIKEPGRYGIANGLLLPDSAEYGLSINFKQDDLVQFFALTFRIARIKISKKVYQLLVANLPEDEFRAEDLKRLYAMRWGIETSFRNLKYIASILKFSYNNFGRLTVCLFVVQKTTSAEKKNIYFLFYPASFLELNLMTLTSNVRFSLYKKLNPLFEAEPLSTV